MKWFKSCQYLSMKLLGIYYVHQLLPLLYVSNVIYQNTLILIPVSWLTFNSCPSLWIMVLYLNWRSLIPERQLYIYWLKSTDQLVKILLGYRNILWKVCGVRYKRLILSSINWRPKFSRTQSWYIIKWINLSLFYILLVPAWLKLIWVSYIWFQTLIVATRCFHRRLCALYFNIWALTQGFQRTDRSL